MQYLSDANYRQNVNLRMPGQSPPYYPDRLTDRSVPNVDEILRRGEPMPDRYGDVRRATNCPPPPMPPAAPQSVGWLWSPRRNALPLDPHFNARRNELPADPQHEDFSKHDGNYTYAFNSMRPGGRADYGFPIDTRRSVSPIATRRNGSPIHTRRNEPPTDLANYMNIFSENLPEGRANESPTDPRLNVSYIGQRRTGSPIGRGRSVSPIDTQRDYANSFSQNLPGGPAMFNAMSALPVVRNMDSINPSDPHFHTQTSHQERHPTHFNAERWSNYDDGSSENYNGNRSFQDFEANRSSLNVDGYGGFQNFNISRIIPNMDANSRFQNFNVSFQSSDGNRSSLYFNDYHSGNDSGFVNDRPSYGSERRNFANFGNFGGSYDTKNYSLIDQGFNRQGINSLLHLNTSYPPAKERKRKAEKLDDSLTEKRACPERIEKVFRIGGFRLEYATHNTLLELPQPEKRSHAVRFFKKYPAYRIGIKKSNPPAAIEVECSLIESDDMEDAIIRHTIAEEWKKVYREKNYRSWGSWWNDYKDCGDDICKELHQFDNYNVQKSFRPLEGPIDSEEYIRLAIAALKENNITYLKNMQDIYRLVDFTVLENLTADASGHLQDIIRSIPNHLWRYKMRSMIFTWTWYQKLANCENPVDETRQSIMPLWNNPILHWLAKQAFDELILLSKVESSNLKEAHPQGPPKQSSDPDQEKES
ncbi:uncharacterized protein LOC111077854 isoform X2 [Drosophila obscura]|uniref:uncharacterized protein LOC111077854 isoform X2 n=1 Tax=Drosophila obscura TaxID=7282 RepID=UPI001BB29FEE|nr:uncharacterized protein LOC111077854 isoform X2 [Drosophila obscura]